jgi:hypothetical protein
LPAGARDVESSFGPRAGQRSKEEVESLAADELTHEEEQIFRPADACRVDGWPHEQRNDMNLRGVEIVLGDMASHVPRAHHERVQGQALPPFSLELPKAT